MPALTLATHAKEDDISNIFPNIMFYTEKSFIQKKTEGRFKTTILALQYQQQFNYSLSGNFNAVRYHYAVHTHASPEDFSLSACNAANSTSGVVLCKTPGEAG